MYIYKLLDLDLEHETTMSLAQASILACQATAELFEGCDDHSAGALLPSIRFEVP